MHAALGTMVMLRPGAPGDASVLADLAAAGSALAATGTMPADVELAARSGRPHHRVLVAELADRFRGYGLVAGALLSCGPRVWTLEQTVLSAQTMTRGIGIAILRGIWRTAAEHGARLEADYVPTSSNRAMYVTFRFAGFTDIRSAAVGLSMATTGPAPHPPPYLTRFC
jgi:hypothetical protein